MTAAVDSILTDLGSPPTAPTSSAPPRQARREQLAPSAAPTEPQERPVGPVRPMGGIGLDEGDASDYGPSPSADGVKNPPPFTALRPPTGPDPSSFPPTAGGAQGQHLQANARRTSVYTLHVHASRNNTLLTLADPSGNVPKKGWVSGGLCKFKKANRSSYEACYQCAITMFRRIEEEQLMLLKRKDEAGQDISSMIALIIKFDGFGPGREAVYRALLTQEGHNTAKLVQLLVDSTPLKIGGTRAKKMRRL